MTIREVTGFEEVRAIRLWHDYHRMKDAASLISNWMKLQDETSRYETFGRDFKSFWKVAGRVQRTTSALRIFEL
jgi:hypothetical protein